MALGLYDHGTASLAQQEVPLLPVTRQWFDAHATCVVDSEYRSATPYWTRRLLTCPPPPAVCFVNGYRPESLRVTRRVLSSALIPLEDLEVDLVRRHGFTGPVIRLKLGEVSEYGGAWSHRMETFPSAASEATSRRRLQECFRAGAARARVDSERGGSSKRA